jgi:para-aminobenzoate synthetase component 1
MADSAFLPIVEPLSPNLSPEAAFERLAHLPGVLFLDSALADGKNGQCSFVCADPVDWFEARLAEDAPWRRIALEVERHRTASVAGLPPFQGGLAGLFGYELARSLERLPLARFDEFELPILALGLYDVVLAFDLSRQGSWLISQGLPETDPALRRRRAEQRSGWFERQLRSWAPRSRPAKPPGTTRLAPHELAPQFPTPRHALVTSSFSQAGYLDAVGRCIDYIGAGDVFQVNLSQRLLHPATTDSLAEPGSGPVLPR